jgi:hypothetical protein
MRRRLTDALVLSLVAPGIVAGVAISCALSIGIAVLRRVA